MMDTLQEVYQGYDTTTVYEALAAKDGNFLSTRLDRIVTQLFIFDVNEIRSLIDLSQFDELQVSWAGKVINIDGTPQLSFWLAAAAHLFFAVPSQNESDTVTVDTTVSAISSGLFMLNEGDYQGSEIQVYLLMQDFNEDTCEIQTDYVDIVFISSVTEVSYNQVLAEHAAKLHAHYGSGGVRIIYDLAEPAYVSLDVYNISGRLIQNITRGMLPAGQSISYWNYHSKLGQKASTGAYILRMDGAKAGLRRTKMLQVP